MLIVFLVWKQMEYIVIVSGYEIGINFDKVSLAVEKKLYLTKIVNV